MINHSCTFSGPRPFHLPYGFEEDHPDCVRLKLMLGMEIEAMIARGCHTFWSGMCWGVDIWCAEMALEMAQAFPEKRICLNAVIPFEEQHRGWTTEYQDRYFAVLEQCAEVIILHGRFVEGCYRERDRYMLDRSGRMIAVCGGEPGGTKNAVEYARCKGLEIVLLHPAAHPGASEFTNIVGC